MTQMKVALVTGASSGIGADTAIRLAESGFVVYGAARRKDRMAELLDKGITALPMDITDEISVRSAVATIIETSGRIDVLVNNAGYGSYGAIEDVSMDEARRQMDVNVFGLAQLTRVVLPHMRSQNSGTIINVSSMGGKMVTPLGGWYHASKYAVEALSDALRLETSQFGIRTVVVEPGSIRTEWGSLADENLRAVSENGAYAEIANRVGTSLSASSEPGTRTTSGPDVVAKKITKIARSQNPKTRYRVGFGARPMLFLRWLLPDRAFDRVIKAAFGL
ncbi:oxidoreductase [Rhodococcus sp. NPDC057297]|uniref:oxidoreductase n=1 Tax=Rhodococcus sp. NPDC057297 TaxID=3346090 RepID=UPI00363D5497